MLFDRITLQSQFIIYMISTQQPIFSCQKTQITLLSNLVVLAFSLFILMSPFLQNGHPLPQALQTGRSNPNSKTNGRQIQQIINVGIFNILICLFSVSTIIFPYKPLRNNFISLFAAIFLTVSNWVLAIQLINLKSILSYLRLPQNVIIYQWGKHCWRGTSDNLAEFFSYAIIFALVVCVPATVFNIAYWKQQLTNIMKCSENKSRNILNKNVLERNRNGMGGLIR